MQSKSSTSTLFIVVLLILTFPVWLGIAGGIFGVVAGLFGAVVGIFAGIVGAIAGIAGGIFGWFFGWDWPFSNFFHWNTFTIVAIALIVVLLSRSKKI